MSKAKLTFESSIKDAETLLDHFDAINKLPPPENAEVLKRAGLIMALTAWETYVEDRVREEMQMRLHIIEGSPAARFILGRLEQELNRFNTPNTDKTKRLFLDYLDVDVTTQWEWVNCNNIKAKKTLDELIVRRGEIVHRSKPVQTGASAPHLVKREELEKHIRFLKSLVEATDKALCDI